MTKKLYCYVDESGQDTQGDLFIVSVVIAAEDKAALEQVLETIEHETGKARRKWSKTTSTRRIAYIRRVLNVSVLRGKLNFALYRNTRNYLALTVRTIAQALGALEAMDYRTVVLIDALPPTQARIVGAMLHHSGVPVKKVRGVRRDENDALIRLADAVCGFARAAHEGQPEMRELFEQALRSRVLRDLTGRDHLMRE